MIKKVSSLLQFYVASKQIELQISDCAHMKDLEIPFPYLTVSELTKAELFIFKIFFSHILQNRFLCLSTSTRCSS